MRKSLTIFLLVMAVLILSLNIQAGWTGGIPNVGAVPITVANGGTGSGTAPTSGQLLVGNAGGTAFAPQSITGDVALTSAGVSTINASASVLTAGDLTYASQSLLRRSIHKFSWTNAQVVGLGANLSGNLKVCTLPAKTVVGRVWVVITGQGAGTTTLTLSVGRTSALYIDYLIALNAKAAANTVYGKVVGDLGVNLTGYDLPSYTGTTDINLQFVAIDVAKTLADVTGSTGVVYLETITLP